MRCVIRGLAALVLCGWVAGAAAQQETPPMIGDVEYQKLATREETRRRVMRLLRPEMAVWGEWHLLTPFEYHPKRGPDLAHAWEVERELGVMRANGPGPDLAASYAGKGGTEATWRPLGDIRNRAVELRVHDDESLNENVVCYLYATVHAERAVSLDVTMGSDDGLRFWLNGRLLVDKDVQRGLNPEDERVRLDLHPGVNHVLAKVSNGAVSYQYQISTQIGLSPEQDALLEYHLNRDFPPTPEELYYRAITIPVPADVVLEVGGLDVLPDGRPIVSTRRGDVYIVENAYDDPPTNARFHRFASGLHEPLGLAVRVERGTAAVYTVQRGELTRLVDVDGDGVADAYETFSDGWGVSGNYHEFAFGPRFDRDGNAWVTLNIGFCGSLGKSVAPLRGWALKVTPRGEVIPVCDGLRSPNGIGMFSDGEMFYLDNQGDYVGTNRLSHLAPGSWHGHPASLRWRDDWRDGEPHPPRMTAAVWFPYKKMGQSAADFLLLDAGAGGADMPPTFAPFAGQVFVGDQTLCSVMRVDLEKVGDVYQGACFPFRGGLDCGVNRLAWGSDGSMFVGQTDRGWGSIGRLRYGLQRIVPTGLVPFELGSMRLTRDGFELTFTGDVDAQAAGDAASYAMVSYTYDYHQKYGSPEVEQEPQRITGVEVIAARTVRLKVESLREGGEGYVHELSMPGVRSAGGGELLHGVAYYTLQRRHADGAPEPGAQGRSSARRP